MSFINITSASGLYTVPSSGARVIGVQGTGTIGAIGTLEEAEVIVASTSLNQTAFTFAPPSGSWEDFSVTNYQTGEVLEHSGLNAATGAVTIANYGINTLLPVLSGGNKVTTGLFPENQSETFTATLNQRIYNLFREPSNTPTVAVAGTAVAPADVTLEGNTITLANTVAVANGAEVVITYQATFRFSQNIVQQGLFNIMVDSDRGTSVPVLDENRAGTEVWIRTGTGLSKEDFLLIGTIDETTSVNGNQQRIRISPARGLTEDSLNSSVSSGDEVWYSVSNIRRQSGGADIGTNLSAGGFVFDSAVLTAPALGTTYNEGTVISITGSSGLHLQLGN